jgi:hypothetical protein
MRYVRTVLMSVYAEINVSFVTSAEIQKLLHSHDTFENVKGKAWAQCFVPNDTEVS